MKKSINKTNNLIKTSPGKLHRENFTRENFTRETLLEFWGLVY